MNQTKRCSMCRVDLDDSTASPSAQRKGGYCRQCAAEYMREYKPGKCVICAGRASFGYMRCQHCANEGRRRHRTVSRNAQKRSQELRINPATGRPALTKAWKTLRRSVIDEETNCGLCGEMVDKTLPGNDPRAASLDHIVLLSLGGDPFARTNLRLAHHGCNARGGNISRSGGETVQYLRLALALAAAGL